MTGKQKATTLLAALLVLGSVAAALGEEFELTYKFEEGQVFDVKSVTYTGRDMGGMAMNQTQELFFSQKVRSVTEGTADIEIKIKRVKMASSNPMTGDVSFDSDSDEESDDPQMALVKGMVGKTFSFKINGRGEILSVSGYDEIFKEIMKTVEEQTKDNPQAAMIMMLMEKTFSNATMKKTLSMGYVIFPEKAVGPDAEWKREVCVPLPMFGDVKGNPVHKIKSVEDETVSVEIDGKLKAPKGDPEIDPDDPMSAMRGMMKIKGGTVSGSAEFDKERGQIKKSVLDTKTTVEAMGNEFALEWRLSLEMLDHGAEEPAEDDAGEEEDGF